MQHGHTSQGYDQRWIIRIRVQSALAIQDPTVNTVEKTYLMT